MTELRPQFNPWQVRDTRTRDVAVTSLLAVVALTLRWLDSVHREPSLGEIAVSTATLTGFYEVVSGPLAEQCPPLLWLFFKGPSMASGALLEVLRLQIALLSSITCALVYPLFRSILSTGGAAVAAVILAVHPAAVAVGSTVGPEGLVLPALLLASYYLIRALETNYLKHWLLLDGALVLLLTSHRGAIVAAIGVALIMTLRILVLPNHQLSGQRVESRERLLRRLGIHLGAVFVLCIPAGALILRNPMFPTESFDLWSLREWFMVSLWGDQIEELPALGYVAGVFGWLLVLPAVLFAVRIRSWRALATPGAAIATVFIVMLVAQAPGGFKFHGAELAALTVPGLALGLGACLMGAVRGIQIASMTCLTLAWILSGPSHPGPRLPIEAVMTRIKETAQPGDPVLVWPAYLNMAARYYLGSKAAQPDLLEFLKGLSDPPPDQKVHVALIRWPLDNARTITLRAALELYGKDAELWQANERGEVITVRQIDRQLLANWNADPRTLDTDNKPVPRLTMYHWVATDELFTTQTRAFHLEPNELLFEPSGRRVIWTRVPEVHLQPAVALGEGSYELQLNCSPIAEGAQPRLVNVRLSAFESQSFPIDRESTLTLPFTLQNDIRSLSVRIFVNPMLDEDTGRGVRRKGLKIHSMSIVPRVEAVPR